MVVGGAGSGAPMKLNKKLQLHMNFAVSNIREANDIKNRGVKIFERIYIFVSHECCSFK